MGETVEMECVCGEILRAEKLPTNDGLWKLYQEHMMRDDHKPSPAQWTEAARRIEKAKESKKSGS